MRNNVVIASLWAFFTAVFITVAVAILAATGYLNPNPYTETVSCTVMGEADQAAIGKVFVFQIDRSKSVKLQKSKCVNMADVDVGDNFTAIMVMDDKDALQCIVKVK